jgi:hypothetical protein
MGHYAEELRLSSMYSLFDVSNLRPRTLPRVFATHRHDYPMISPALRPSPTVRGSGHAL